MTGRCGIQTVYSAPNHSIRSAIKPGTCRTLLTKASIDPAAVRANHGSRADLLPLGLHWGSAQSGLSGYNAKAGELECQHSSAVSYETCIRRSSSWSPATSRCDLSKPLCGRKMRSEHAPPTES